MTYTRIDNNTSLCICGSIIKRGGYGKHKQSIKHIKYCKINNIEHIVNYSTILRTERVNCDCGGYYKYGYRYKHYNTKRHERYIISYFYLL